MGMERSRGRGEKERKIEERGWRIQEEEGREGEEEEGGEGKGNSPAEEMPRACLSQQDSPGMSTGRQLEEGARPQGSPSRRGRDLETGSVLGVGEKGFGKGTCFLEKQQHSRIILTPLPRPTLPLAHLPILAPCPNLHSASSFQI